MWLETIDSNEQYRRQCEVPGAVPCSRKHQCHRDKNHKDERIEKQPWEKRAEVITKWGRSPVCRFPLNGIEIEASQLGPNGLPPEERVDGECNPHGEAGARQALGDNSLEREDPIPKEEHQELREQQNGNFRTEYYSSENEEEDPPFLSSL